MSDELQTRKPVVLVADDQDNMRNIITRLLGLEGYAFDVASTGKRAIEVMEARVIDVALLDISMPGMDGIAVVEHMKQSPALSRIPIIMITGHVDSSSVLRCKTLGVDDYLVKPYKVAVLLSRIAVALDRARALDPSVPYPIPDPVRGGA